MKKIYAFALCGAVCLSASADGQRFQTVRGQKGKKSIPTEAAAPLWRPASQTDYMHDGEDWMEMGTVTFKYDGRGNRTEELVDEDGWLSKTVTTYDEFNYPLMILQTESEDGETWENSGKRTYVYDTKVHGFFTERIGYDWNDGEWTKNYTWESNTITRNDEGDIIEVVKALPLMGELKPAYKSVWNYGTDGKANEYFYYVAGADNDWELYDNLSYKDIVWEKTDGQMTVFGDLLELTEGDNLLKSAVVYYDGEPDGHYLVEYSDGLPGFLIKETTNDISEIGRTVRMETIDANGSMRLTTTEYFDEDGNILTEPTYIDVQEALMDEYGNMVKYSETETIDGVEELISSTRYTYTYNADGNPTEVISEEYDYETEEYFLSERIVYGEYIDAAAGIEAVMADGSTTWTVNGDAVTAAAPGLTGLSVYNLQGASLMHTPAEASSATVSLASFAPGVYLIHADGAGSTYRIIKH